MKKNLLALLLAALMLLSVIPASAESLLPWTGDTITYHFMCPDLITENPETEVYKAFKEDLGNVELNLEIIAWSDYGTKLNLYKNSGDVADLAWNGDFLENRATYGDQYWLNLTPYLENMPYWSHYLETMPAMAALKDEKGDIYGVAQVTEYDWATETWFYNKTALTALGYNEPPKTMDEMYEMMLAYKAANPDNYAFITYAWGFWQWQNTWSQIGGWEKGDFFYNEEKQSWDSSILNDESGYKATIELMSKLYADGLIPQDFDAIPEQTVHAAVVEGNWLFGFFYNTSVESEFFMNTEMPYELGHFVTPALTEGAQQYGRVTTRFNNRPTNGYQAAAGVEHPEVMASLMDYTLSPEANALYTWGIKGVSYEVDENGKKYFLEDYATNTDKRNALGINGLHLLRYNQVTDQFASMETMLSVSKSALVELINAFGDGTLKPQNFDTMNTPILSVEDNDLIAQNKTPTATYLDEQKIKFVTGERPMDEWDAFKEEYKTYGDIQLIIDLYNAGEPNPIDQERRYPELTID